MTSRNQILVSKSLYHIGYMTLVASIVWVGVGVYIATSKNVPLDVDSSILEPISPKLDQEMIVKLSGRVKVEEMASSSATIDTGGVR